MSIEELIDFVNGQKAFQERLLEKNANRTDQSTLNAQSFRRDKIIPSYKKVIEALEAYNQRLNSPMPTDNKEHENFFDSLSDMSDLPPEIKKELNISESDKLTMDICKVLELAGQPLGIDQILIGLFRLKNRTEKRDVLSRKLYRMTKDEEIISVPKRKGIYALPDYEELKYVGEDSAAPVVDNEEDSLL